jgi:alkanesulfonate monooxygenase SsuD/methylene tetrahydromethanopterin reductase-like flavin-dependent oxidoreductase (luciferase family)
MQEFALVGTPEQIAEQVAEKVLPQGVGGLIVNMPFSGHVPGTVQAIGQILAPLIHA